MKKERKKVENNFHDTECIKWSGCMYIAMGVCLLVCECGDRCTALRSTVLNNFFFVFYILCFNFIFQS